MRIFAHKPTLFLSEEVTEELLKTISSITLSLCIIQKNIHNIVNLLPELFKKKIYTSRIEQRSLYLNIELWSYLKNLL